MLTIFALNNAQQAGKYYEEDNYYIRDSVEAIAATHWWGKGAALLGLSDYVDPDRFVELLNGKIDQNTILQRVRHDGGVSHKPGYDLTFSAPKSVSMLAEIGRDFRIYDAHNAAVNAALSYLESRVSQYRKTVDSNTQVLKGDNVIVAKFRHDTSRSVDETIDCQLHTHCVVANAVKGDDGKWRSLYERPIFDFKMTGGMIYRSVLAKELKSIGYQIEKTREDGLFEIAGFSRDDIEAFSRRRVKIVEVMKEQGLLGVHAAQEVTLKTRESKNPIDREKLAEHWSARASELGLNLDGLITESKQRERAISKNGGSVIDTKMAADKALEYALNHLAERQSVFQEKDIIKTSLQYALGDITIDDVNHAMTRFKDDKRMVFLGERDHREIYTTPNILAMENAIVEAMHAGKNEYDAIATKEAVTFFLQEITDRLADEMKPTNCQMSAIQFLAESTDKIVGVQGYAGTGKTTMLKGICELATTAGYQLRGAAPSASAADVLRSDTGLETNTLSGLLIELAKEKAVSVEQQAPEIIILDEASMASTHQMYELVKQADRLNKRLFLVGDKLQLPAIEAGSPFTLLQDNGLSTTYLKQVVRQKADDIKWSVNEAIHGDVGYALQAIGNEAFIARHADGAALSNAHSTVTEIENKSERLTQISQAYLNLDEQGKKDTIILLGSNEDRQVVNEQIRSGLKAQAPNGNEIDSSILKNKGLTLTEKQHVYNYSVGDIVRFNKSYRSLGIKRFDYLTVTAIDQAKQTLVLSKNRRNIEWQPNKLGRNRRSVVEIYENEERKLAAGDRIRWTQNRKNLEIYNTDLAEVISVDDNSANIKLKNGKSVDLDLTHSINQHWDYAWSSTVYAAQGKKAKNVIAQLEGYNPNLTNYRAFYVTISRAVDTIHLYVDNLKKATRTIQEHTGEKSNASQFLLDFQCKSAVEKHIKKAPEKLDGNIHVLKSEEGRLAKLAEHYVELGDINNNYLLATDFKDKQRLNALIRYELKKKNILGENDILVPQLRPYRIRSLDEVMKLLPGMMIHFERSYKKWRIIRGYYTVDSILDITNQAKLKSKAGEIITVDVPFLVARQNKDVSIYKRDLLPLSIHEQIRWTRNNKESGINSEQSASIQAINQNGVTVLLANQQSLTLSVNSAALWHWRYDYVKEPNDKNLKPYHYALAHLDNRTQSPARIAAMFGALGKAKKAAHIYTHSKDYVVNHLRNIIKEEIDLKPYVKEDINNAFYNLLSQLNSANQSRGKAWASYFENKKLGKDTNETLRNSLIINRAYSELANRVVLNKNYDAEKIKALGYNSDTIKQSVNRYLSSYLNHHAEARKKWSAILAAKDSMAVQSRYDYATHTSQLRNKFAYDIINLEHQLNELPIDLYRSIQNDAKQFEDSLTEKAKQELINKTKNWREIIFHDGVTKQKNRHIQYHVKKTRKVYHDRESVLQAIIPKAETLISSLIDEEKNTRRSNDNKIVWGKKNGSVHYHISGAKTGVVNDYERNIHGDLITFYAKSRGLDWYDALSELADNNDIKTNEVVISKQLKEQCEQDNKKELKRRARVAALASKTWDEAIPIKDTLVETYLKKHRGADFDVSAMSVRYHPSAPMYHYRNDNVRVFARKPAMVVRFNNAQDELTAVQCTYLDPNTANKDQTVKIVKNTIGSQWGSAGLIYQGGDDKVIIAEGAETAMSLIQAEPESTIYITGGNMQNIQHYEMLALKHGVKTLHIAADNDLSKEAGSWKSLEAGVKELAKCGIQSLVSAPDPIKGKKTDFNDVYKRYGSLEAKRQFVPKYFSDLDNVGDKSALKLLVDSKNYNEIKPSIDVYKLPKTAFSKLHLSIDEM